MATIAGIQRKKNQIVISTCFVRSSIDTYMKVKNKQNFCWKIKLNFFVNFHVESRLLFTPRFHFYYLIVLNKLKMVCTFFAAKVNA